MHGGELLRLRQRRTPQTHALRFRHGDALRLTLMNELPLSLGRIAEQLQNNVGDQRSGEILIFLGIQQVHIQHDNGRALLFGHDPPLLRNLIVIPAQPVNALDHKGKIEKQEMKLLHPDHISAYLDAAEQRGALPMFYLELVSGLRKGELVALQWSDLDEANCTISVSKQASWDTEGNFILSQPKTGNSIREVPVPQDAVELLKQEHAKHPDNPWMFPSSRTGEMYHPDSVVNLHKKILKDAGLEHIRFHDLRHTFATLALQNGVDVKTVSSMLGHYDAGFTLRTYTHATRQKQDEAAQTMGSFMAQVM